MKKFRTKVTNYTVRFNIAMADDKVTNLHGQLHTVIQQILDDTVGDATVNRRWLG